MSLKTIKNENGVYVELPKDKIEFVSKEAEIIYDLSLENDFLEKKNQKYKEIIDKAIEHLDLFISSENLSKYDTLKILMHTKKILKEVE